MATVPEWSVDKYGNKARPLSDEELSGFLSRNPSFYLPTSLWWFTPEYGTTVQDSELGLVFVFVDQEGTPRYTVGTNQSLANEMKKPAYVSPPNYGEPLLESIKIIAFVVAAAVVLPSLLKWGTKD